MKIIQLFISADSIHICKKAFSYMEVITVQGHTFPFCQGVNDLHGALALFLDSEADRPLHAV